MQFPHPVFLSLHLGGPSTPSQMHTHPRRLREVRPRSIVSASDPPAGSAPRNVASGPLVAPVRCVPKQGRKETLWPSCRYGGVRTGIRLVAPWRPPLLSVSDSLSLFFLPVCVRAKRRGPCLLFLPLSPSPSLALSDSLFVSLSSQVTVCLRERIARRRRELPCITPPTPSPLSSWHTQTEYYNDTGCISENKEAYLYFPEILSLSTPSLCISSNLNNLVSPSVFHIMIDFA